MHTCLRFAAGAFALMACLLPLGAAAFRCDTPCQPVSEHRVAVGSTSLYVRETGKGPAVIVLHGGPDFDHGYLLPDLDRLGDAYRLIYYDQRGRGRSAEGVVPGDVSLASELDDIDQIRRHFRLDAPIVLGHSWGGVLALEYALRYPDHVSRLILMNPAPVSAADLAAARKTYLERLGQDMDRQRDIRESDAYKAADPEAVAARYRIHFKPAVQEPADYERLMTTMRAGFVRQGSRGILLARAVEDRLMGETWALDGYDLTPRLRALRIPTLVIAGRHDFMASAAGTIAQAIPGARLVVIEDCGHFAYLECGGETLRALKQFVR